MKKIFVLSVGEIQLRNDLDNFAIISYRDASGVDIISLQNYSLPKNEKILNHKNILCIEADDVEFEIKEDSEQDKGFKLIFKNIIDKIFNKKLESNFPIVLFNEMKAKEVIEFAMKNKDKDIIVQCIYGKSRSLTTAIFLEEMVLKDTHILEHKEKVIRNNSFMTLLKNVFSKLKS